MINPFMKIITNKLSSILAGTVTVFMLSVSAAHGQAIVQSFYVPFDEDEVHVALNTIDEFDGNIGSQPAAVSAGGVELVLG